MTMVINIIGACIILFLFIFVSRAMLLLIRELCFMGGRDEPPEEDSMADWWKRE